MKNGNYILLCKSTEMDFEQGQKLKKLLGVIVCYHSSSQHWKCFGGLFLTSSLQHMCSQEASSFSWLLKCGKSNCR